MRNDYRNGYEWLGTYEIVVKIKARAMSEEEALDEYSDILFFIQDNLELGDYKIIVEKVDR